MPRRGKGSGSQAPAAAPSEGRERGAVTRDLEAQEEIPLPQAAPPVPQGPPRPAFDPSSVVGLREPSRHPRMPVTSGIRGGAGPGPEALVFGASKLAQLSELERYVQETGDVRLRLMLERALRRG